MSTTTTSRSSSASGASVSSQSQPSSRRSRRRLSDATTKSSRQSSRPSSERDPHRRKEVDEGSDASRCATVVTPTEVFCGGGAGDCNSSPNVPILVAATPERNVGSALSNSDDPKDGRIDEIKPTTPASAAEQITHDDAPNTTTTTSNERDDGDHEDDGEHDTVSINPEIQSIISAGRTSQRYSNCNEPAWAAPARPTSSIASAASSHADVHDGGGGGVDVGEGSDVPSQHSSNASTPSSAGRSLFDDAVPPPYSDEPQDAFYTTPPQPCSAAGGGLEHEPTLTTLLGGKTDDSCVTPTRRRKERPRTPMSDGGAAAASLHQNALDAAFLAEYVFVHRLSALSSTALEALREEEAARHQALLADQAALDDCLESLAEFVVWYQLEWQRKCRSAAHRAGAFPDVPSHQGRQQHPPAAAATTTLSRHAQPHATSEHPHPHHAIDRCSAAQHVQAPLAPHHLLALHNISGNVLRGGRQQAVASPDTTNLEAFLLGSGPAGNAERPPEREVEPRHDRPHNNAVCVELPSPGSVSMTCANNYALPVVLQHDVHSSSGCQEPVVHDNPCLSCSDIGGRGSSSSPLGAPAVGSGSPAMFGGALSPTLHHAQSSSSFRSLPPKAIDQASALLHSLTEQDGSGVMVGGSCSPSPSPTRFHEPVVSVGHHAYGRDVSPELHISWATSSAQSGSSTGEQSPPRRALPEVAPADAQVPVGRRRAELAAARGPSAPCAEAHVAAPSHTTTRALKAKMIQNIATRINRAMHSLRDTTPHLVGCARRLMDLEQEAQRLRRENANLETLFLDSRQSLVDFQHQVGYRSEAELDGQLHSTLLQHQQDQRALHDESVLWKKAAKQARLLSIANQQRVHLLEHKIVTQSEHHLRGGDTVVRLQELCNRQLRLMDKLKLELHAETLRTRRETALAAGRRLITEEHQMYDSPQSPERTVKARRQGSVLGSDRLHPPIQRDVFNRLTSSLPSRWDDPSSPSPSKRFQEKQKVSGAQSLSASPKHNGSSRLPAVGNFWGRLPVEDRAL